MTKAVIDKLAIARISRLSPFGKSAADNLFLVVNDAASRIFWKSEK
ncbi:MAG: hypothetical protein IKX31_06580 [Muribaculaceae bacterium]|nr:hypothetical protein [Muribaculaceae bacterium]